MKGEVDIMDESNDALRQESDRPGGMFQRERSVSGPTMVVGVDGSEYSRRALEWASDEAKRRGAILHIVCAGYGTWQTTPAWYDATSDEQPAQAIVDDAVALVATRHPSVITRGESRVWPAALALVEYSRSNDLLVVGARGEGGFVGLLVGSVSDECIRHADCPVVVVHAEPEGTPTPAPDDRIVVGIDGSPGSRQALRWALWEARSMSSSVEAVFAWHYPRAYAVFVGPVEGYAAAQREIVAEATALAEEWEPDVPFKAIARVGPVVPSLLEESAKARLLVVGARGHGTFAELILGSVAAQCAHHATCPVAVVRPFAVSA